MKDDQAAKLKTRRKVMSVGGGPAGALYHLLLAHRARARARPEPGKIGLRPVSDDGLPAGRVCGQDNRLPSQAGSLTPLTCSITRTSTSTSWSQQFVNSTFVPFMVKNLTTRNAALTINQ